MGEGLNKWGEQMDNATFFLVVTLVGILIFGLLYLITVLLVEGPLD